MFAQVGRMSIELHQQAGAAEQPREFITRHRSHGWLASIAVVVLLALIGGLGTGALTLDTANKERRGLQHTDVDYNVVPRAYNVYMEVWFKEDPDDPLNAAQFEEALLGLAELSPRFSELPNRPKLVVINSEEGSASDPGGRFRFATKVSWTVDTTDECEAERVLDCVQRGL